jgi:hypothetical protein
VVDGLHGEWNEPDRGAGMVCILIFREGARHHELGRFGMWGRLGGLLLGKMGDGEGERGP